MNDCKFYTVLSLMSGTDGDYLGGWSVIDILLNYLNRYGLYVRLFDFLALFVNCYGLNVRLFFTKNFLALFVNCYNLYVWPSVFIIICTINVLDLLVNRYGLYGLYVREFSTIKCFDFVKIYKRSCRTQCEYNIGSYYYQLLLLFFFLIGMFIKFLFVR